MKTSVEKYKEQFPKGTRVKLIFMDDDFTELKEGDLGTVSSVDDIGNIHVDWDNGSKLALVPGIDKFETILSEDTRDTNNFIELKEYFKENYGYIELPSDNIIKQFSSNYSPVEKAADLMSDYLLSQGISEVVEGVEKSGDGDEPTKELINEEYYFDNTFDEFEETDLEDFEEDGVVICTSGVIEHGKIVSKANVGSSINKLVQNYIDNNLSTFSGQFLIGLNKQDTSKGIVNSFVKVDELRLGTTRDFGITAYVYVIFIKN